MVVIQVKVCVMQQTPTNNTEYSQIVQAIQDAVMVASGTSYQPEAKLRELVDFANDSLDAAD